MIEVIEFSEDIQSLRDAYLKAQVVGPASKADADYEKIRGFQAINLLQGYKPIQIFSPKEVVDL